MWVVVEGTGSYGVAGKRFSPGRTWVDDEAVLAFLVGLPDWVKVEPGDAPESGHEVEVAVVEPLHGPLTREDLRPEPEEEEPPIVMPKVKQVEPEPKPVGDKYVCDECPRDDFASAASLKRHKTMAHKPE